MTALKKQGKGWFITGTDTNVGKTFVASGLVRSLNQQGLRTGAYKPAASGGERNSSGEMVWGDVETLHEAMEGAWPRERICPQRFLAPLAPPQAARREGKVLDEELLIAGARWWEEQVDLVIVEGAGGWLSPLSDSWSNADFAERLGYPVLVVARLGLGTINHTLLTLEAIERRGVPILGVVMTEGLFDPGDVSVEGNPEELGRLTKHPVLGVIRHQSDRSVPEVLQRPGWGELARKRER